MSETKVRESMLKAERRDGKARNVSRKGRVENFIPAVIYNRNENMIVKLNRHDFEKEMPHLRSNTRIAMDLEGQTFQVIIRDYAFDHRTQSVQHVDFYKLIAKTPVKVKIPIELHGLAKGLQKGGLIRRHTTTLEIKCMPEDIPTRIDLEISHLDTDDVIFVRDLPKIEAFKNVPYEILSSPDQGIVSITVSSRAASSAAQDKPAAGATAGETDGEAAAPAKEETST